MSNTRFLALALAVGLVIPLPVQAELGGAASSLPVERGLIAPRATEVAMSGYTRRDITRANGGTVRELVNAGGQVFAVTWSGPGKPDLRTLLGRYFTAMQTPQEGAGGAMHSLRRPLQVNRPDLQIQTGGHMGWFNGVAFLPALAPANFDTTELSPKP